MALPEMPDLTTLGYVTALAVVNWFISGHKGKQGQTERRSAFAEFQAAVKEDFAALRQDVAVSQAMTKAEFTAVHVRVDEFCTRLDDTAALAGKGAGDADTALKIVRGVNGDNGLHSRVVALEKAERRTGSGRRAGDVDREATG